MDRSVWITGIGLVSCLGEGLDAHWHAMAETAEPQPVVDRTRNPPFTIHPLTPLDFDKQIPKKGDQRQMEPWQRIGTYTAGLALADAGLAGNIEILSETDLIVAAGGGERDQEVDNTILTGIGDAPDAGVFLNERLNSDLRPTLFLAQLANLLAGNISIVHKVTGSSRTFMGEESAGVSAVDIAARRIRAGQSEVCLVGGSFNAERYEVFVDGNLGGLLWTGDPQPVWKRTEAGGGVSFGSGGAFLVLESAEHARRRGGRAYAELGQVLNDRGRRRPGEARATAERQFAELSPSLRGPAPAISGAIGLEPATSEERAFLEDHMARGEIATVRAPLSLVGACREAEFPMLLGLAALALHRRGFYQPFGDGIETPFQGVPGSVLVTCWGLWRGEGMGVVLPVDA